MQPKKDKEGRGGQGQPHEGLGEPGCKTAAWRLLCEEEVTCDDIVNFTTAVFVIDCATLSVVRQQSRYTRWALNFFVHQRDGKLYDEFPNCTITRLHTSDRAVRRSSNTNMIQ